MGHLREIKNIASGIASSFVSRNNDVDGYWELGKLYKEYGRGKVTLDLIAETIYPQCDRFSRLLELWRYKLELHLMRRGIPLNRLNSAKIEVEFNAEYVHRLHYWGSGLGDPCTCKCEIVTENERSLSVVSGTNCRPHNPLRESRSTRRYETFNKQRQATQKAARLL